MNSALTNREVLQLWNSEENSETDGNQYELNTKAEIGTETERSVDTKLEKTQERREGRERERSSEDLQKL
jgi:hypothetical protein